MAEHQLSDPIEPLPTPAVRGRVLVVDDDPLQARLIHRFISSEHEVIAVAGAREAHELLRAGECFDVILCDLMMPEMTGMDLHDALSRTAPEQAARMVFVTGGAFVPRAQAFLDEVGNARLSKPFDVHELRALVNRRVAEAGQSRCAQCSRASRAARSARCSGESERSRTG